MYIIRLGVFVERMHGVGREERKKDTLLHVLPSGIAKHLRRARRLGDAPRLLHHQPGRPRRILAVLPEALQAAGKHLLEADDEHAVGAAVRDHVATHEQASAARRAVVVDVVHGDARHAELVEDALPAGRVAVAVARHGLVNLVVVDVRVEHRFYARFEAELRVVDFAARLDELRHAHAEDVDGLLLGDHGDVWW